MVMITIDTNYDDDEHIKVVCEMLLRQAGASGSTVLDTRKDEDWTPTKDAQLTDSINDHIDKLASENLRVDPNGVPFDAAMCSTAQDPFYASGKQKGQWKKKKGVTPEVYDAWYAGAKPAPRSDQTQNSSDADPINSADAFGNKQSGSMFDAPTECGPFMGWVSAKQAADPPLLTQQDINSAWAMTGLVGVESLMPPNPPEVVKANIAKMYALLSQTAGA